MKKTLCLALFCWPFFLIGQTKPNAIYIGSSITNDFDDFGWYKNDIILMSDVTFTHRRNDRRIGFGINFNYNSTKADEDKIYHRLYDLYEVYQKNVMRFGIFANYNLYSTNWCLILPSLGISQKYGSGKYIYRRTFDELGESVPYISTGIVLGTDFIYLAPYNFVVRFNINGAYYPFHIDNRNGPQKVPPLFLL